MEVTVLTLPITDVIAMTIAMVTEINALMPTEETTTTGPLSGTGVLQTTITGPGPGLRIIIPGSDNPATGLTTRITEPPSGTGTLQTMITGPGTGLTIITGPLARNSKHAAGSVRKPTATEIRITIMACPAQTTG